MQQLYKLKHYIDSYSILENQVYTDNFKIHCDINQAQQLIQGAVFNQVNVVLATLSSNVVQLLEELLQSMIVQVSC